MIICDRNSCPEQAASLRDEVALRISASRHPRASATPEMMSAPAIDPIASTLAEGLLAEADGRDGALALLGPRHGSFRAREDGTVAALLGEYAAMRAAPAETCAPERVELDAGALATGPAGDEPRGRAALDGTVGDPPPANLHAAIDRAAAAAATAFHAERLRQNRAVLRGQDHEMRGCLNAIRLAAFVHRQTGRDTADIVERQVTRLREALDRSRRNASRAGDRTLCLDDLPNDDLVDACRQETAAWNAARPHNFCAFLFPGSCLGHYDTERIRETLTILLEATVREAGDRSVLRVDVGVGRSEVAISVEAAGASGAAFRAAPPTADWPLRWELARQTARAHGGQISADRSAGGTTYRLVLGIPPVGAV